MARQILDTALARCGMLPAAAGELTQFVQVAGEWLPDTAGVRVADRPPMRELLVR
jgi:glucosyl-3-phosphoglycerate synthase